MGTTKQKTICSLVVSNSCCLTLNIYEYRVYIYIYIYITIHIISDTFRQSRDHLRFLDRECWDVIHLSGSVGMSSTCGAGSMNPG